MPKLLLFNLAPSSKESDRASILIFPALPSASVPRELLIEPSTKFTASITLMSTLPALPIPPGLSSDAPRTKV